MLNGRKVKVMAKLPHIQARIMQQLDKAQSCTLPIQQQHSHTDFINDDKVIRLEDQKHRDGGYNSGSSDDFDFYEDDDNENEKDEINLNYDLAKRVETAPDNHDRTDDTNATTHSTDNLASVEVIVANFAEGTSDQEILTLLADYQVDRITAKVGRVSVEDPFTYAVVRFQSRQAALNVVAALNGASGRLGSNDLVVEINE